MLRHFFCLVACTTVFSVHISEEKCTFPECNLNSTEIIALYGFRPVSFVCRTDDGFHLTLHRITDSTTSRRTPTVLLIHGLLDSSSTFILNGRNGSLGFLLADEGFDVWLGNTRGNRYSLSHDTLSPNEVKFWDWSWDEMARFDLPAMVDCVAGWSGSPSISLIGHSQGTMETFAAMTSPMFPAVIGSRLSSFVALAPVAFLGGMRSELLRALAEARFEELVALWGRKAFLPSSELLRRLLPAVCQLDPDACDKVACLVSGCKAGGDHVDLARWPVYAAHYPSGTSVRNAAHMAQGVRAAGRLVAYDFGSPAANRRRYNASAPPEYPLDRAARLPLLLVSGSVDALADPDDVALLYQRLMEAGGDVTWREMAGWDHLDFVWSAALAPTLRDLIVPHLRAAATQQPQQQQLNVLSSLA